MKKPLYIVEYPEGTGNILNQMREKCATVFGTTFVGNRLTLRFRLEPTQELVEIHMIVENVDDGKPDPANLKTIDQMEYEAISNALGDNEGYTYKAAQALNISQQELLRRMKYHNMKVLRDK